MKKRPSIPVGEGLVPSRAKKKKDFKKPRFPLPPKSEHPHSTKKGKKGYNRKKTKKDEREAIHDAQKDEED